MEAGFGKGREGFVEAFPDLHDQDFAACHFALHEGYIEVDVFVVQLLNNVPLYDIAQHLQIDYKACVGIGFAFHGYDQLEIVAVPVVVGTRPKNFLVPFVRPVGIE